MVGGNTVSLVMLLLPLYVTLFTLLTSEELFSFPALSFLAFLLFFFFLCVLLEAVSDGEPAEVATIGEVLLSFCAFLLAE